MLHMVIHSMQKFTSDENFIKSYLLEYVLQCVDREEIIQVLTIQCSISTDMYAHSLTVTVLKNSSNA